jgi:hypothetical protein
MKKSMPGAAADFPDTEPASLPNLPAEDPRFAEPQVNAPAKPRVAAAEPLGLSLAPVEVSFYEVMSMAGKDNRVCPQPTRWLEMYRILQEAGRSQPLPAQPLTGSAWAATPAMAKRACLREQLEWADRNGCLQRVFEFLQGLPDTDWHYVV